jgi:hypothetical protein
MDVDFGERFAYKGQDARQGKSSEGGQNGKEDFEEGEEDPTDQAVAEAISSSRFQCSGVPGTSAQHGPQATLRWRKGRRREGWRPIFLFKAPRFRSILSLSDFSTWEQPWWVRTAVRTFQQAALLKFSTRGDYFNAGSIELARLQLCGLPCARKRGFCSLSLAMKFGDCVAYKKAAPDRANQMRGKQNGKEDFEEGKEDRSDQAVDNVHA